MEVFKKWGGIVAAVVLGIALGAFWLGQRIERERIAGLPPQIDSVIHHDTITVVRPEIRIERMVVREIDTVYLPSQGVSYTARADTIVGGVEVEVEFISPIPLAESSYFMLNVRIPDTLISVERTHVVETRTVLVTEWPIEIMIGGVAMAFILGYAAGM